MVFLTIGQRLTEVVMTNDLTFGLPLSRLGIVQTNLTLPSLLHRLALLSLLHRLSMLTLTIKGGLTVDFPEAR